MTMSEWDEPVDDYVLTDEELDALDERDAANREGFKTDFPQG